TVREMMFNRMDRRVFRRGTFAQEVRGSPPSQHGIGTFATRYGLPGSVRPGDDGPGLHGRWRWRARAGNRMAACRSGVSRGGPTIEVMAQGLPWGAAVRASRADEMHER